MSGVSDEATRQRICEEALRGLREAADSAGVHVLRAVVLIEADGRVGSVFATDESEEPSAEAMWAVIETGAAAFVEHLGGALVTFPLAGGQG